MNHYEVLGVKRSASKVEIRRAYLKLARRYHPDFNRDTPGSVMGRPPGTNRGDRATHQGGVESNSIPAPDEENSVAFKIRQVNAAWEVLGDEERRAEYDLFLLEAKGRTETIDAGSPQFRAARKGAPSVSRIHRPSSEFTPRDSGPDADDGWRYRPDAVNPATVPSKILLAAPAVCFVAGLGMLILSVPTAIRAFTALGLIFLFLSAVLFVGVPVMAMFKSRNEEMRIHNRR